jgi:hypothetical protein
MSSAPFFLEVGSEEIPDWMIVPALNHLQDSFQRWLDANQVSGKVARVDATPRRLVLWAEGLRSRQEDSTEVLMGPPKSAGEGAMRGFAKKTGATIDQLQTETTAKGEYWKFARAVPGRNTIDPGADPRHSMAEDHVLGWQEWPALDSADSMAGGDSRRRRGAFRDCRRAQWPREPGASAAGRQWRHSLG